MAEFLDIEPWQTVIVAMKGLPYTGKSEIAKLIGEWARCRVFYIDDFLSSVSLEKGYSRQLMPSAEEAERLHRLAFDALCKSALLYFLRYIRGCIVVKSRLCSTFELDRLLQLSREELTVSIIIIVEFHIKNEHRLCQRLECSNAVNIPERVKEWYKAWSTLDLEKARDNWLSNSQPRKWDLHLCNLINADEAARVIRLVLDPFDDLNLGTSTLGISDLSPAFRDAISYLVTREAYGDPREEVNWIAEEIIRDRYEVVQFNKLRRYLVEKELLSATQDKLVNPCPTSRGGKCCVFKTYRKEEDDEEYYNCGVCEERVASEGYTCHFCFLTLHKSCAEHQGVSFTTNFARNMMYYPKECCDYLSQTYACKSCKEGRKDFSEGCQSCLFETHLKCRMFLTIIKHDCHEEHFLSLQVGDDPIKHTECKACDSGLYKGKYGCYVCGLYYCLECVLRPRNVDHNHGGHEHVIKLVCSRDGTEPEEDYWCGICYKDMDPQHWFYSCPDCPCYEAHPHCIVPFYYKYLRPF